MIRLLHTADLHLDAPFPSLGHQAAERQNAFLKTFERLVNLAIKNDVHLFCIAGDLFDSPKPSGAVLGKVQAGIKRLVDRKIIPVLLPGTHDSLVTADAVYRRCEFPGAVVLDAPHVREPLELKVRDQQVFLYGFAYRTFASENALATMTRREGGGIHIGLLHGSRQGSPEWEYRKKDLAFTAPALKQWNLDYLALGHYHNFELIGDQRRVWACYPGAPEGKRFGENGPRYCALVDVEPGRARVEKLVVNSQVLEERELDLSGCENEQAAAEAICAQGKDDLLLRLRLTGIVEAPLDLESLHGRCCGEFFHLEFDDQTRLFDSDFARRIEKEQTVRGVFVRRAQQLMADVPAEKRPIIEEAFREVLVRFRAFGGGEK